MEMTTVLGLGVASDRLRLVAVRRRRVAWARAVDRVPGQSIREAVDAIIASAPIRRVARPRVNVAIGLAASQLRYVEGLPPVTETRDISEIVTQGSSRFLFQRGGPVIITGVRIAKPGAAWVGAVDELLTREVIEACSANGIGVALVLPTLVALSRGAAGNHVVWRDGGMIAEMTFAEHGVEDTRRRRARGTEEDLSRLTPVPELATVGDAACTYADA